jgi:hypothetical protein
MSLCILATHQESSSVRCKIHERKTWAKDKKVFQTNRNGNPSEKQDELSIFN